MKIDKKIIKFDDDTEIGKYKFRQHKNAILIDNINIKKIVVSSKASCCKKDFEYILLVIKMLKTTLLFTFLPKISAYRRDFDKTKCMSSLIIKGEELLEKYNEIGKKSTTLSKRI